MAVRIPVYQQQTSTPDVRLTGGQLTTDVGGNVGGALVDLARGIGAFGQRRDEEKEGLASAWAGDELAKFQSEYPRQADTLKKESGEAGEGYIENINAWRQKREAEILANAPTEKSREFLRNRMREFGTRIDLEAYGYQQAAQNSWIVSKYDDSIKSAADSAASNPGFAPTAIAEVRASIDANPILTFEQKRQKKEALVQIVSYADMDAATERDPYGVRPGLLRRLGLGSDATSADVMQSADSAAAALEKIEADAGFKVPSGQREEAIAALVAGGDIGFNKETGEAVVSVVEGDSELPLTLRSLPVAKVIQLLAKADSEIAKRENEIEQRAAAGKVIFAQKWQDTMVALQNGDPVQLPPMSEALAFYTPQEVEIKYAQATAMQLAAGQLKALEGATTEELQVLQATPPVGADNRSATQAAWEMKARKAAGIIAARKDDPGAFVLSTSPIVQRASEAYADATQRAVNGDQGAISEMPVALRDYISTSLAEQARLGIANPALPKQFVSTIVTDFQTNVKTDPQKAAGSLRFLATMLDGMPETRNAIANSVGDAGLFAMEGVDGQVIRRLVEAGNVKEAQIKELLPNAMPWSDVVTAVTQEFAPLVDTLSRADDRNRFVQNGQKLAANYLATGAYSSAKDAARAAYNDLFANYNDIADSGTYRIPKGMGYDPAAVQVGLTQYVQELTGEELLVEDSGRPLAEARMAKARTVRNQAFWRNNDDDSGAILYAPGGIVVKGADGLPIEVSFEEAQLIQPTVAPIDPRLYRDIR